MILPLPGGAPLPSITGGPATSTSGDVKSELRTAGSGGISSPIVIGGFKSDGTASGGAVPAWVLWLAGIAAAGAVAYLVFRR